MLVYTYNLAMAGLGLLEHATVPKAAGNTAARTRGYILALVLLSLLLTNHKAKEHTRRKVAGWWEEQVLVRLTSQTQTVVIQLAPSQPTGSSQPATSQPADSNQASSQPADSIQATS